MKPFAGPMVDEEIHYKITVVGKHQDPLFQAYRVAVEYLAESKATITCAVEGYFETQYEQKMKQYIRQYGAAFIQSKSSTPLIFAETDDDKVLYFLNAQRFFDWAAKRFKYEDKTRTIFYKRIGNKAMQSMMSETGRTYCALAFTIGDSPPEVVHLELFDEECPNLAANFIKLLDSPKFDGSCIHRVKPGAGVQGGDLVDGSGANSEAAGGGVLRDESFKFLHDRAGLLGMANCGKDTNGSQFYITTKELNFLDGKSVIFGRVISGMRVILRISKVATLNERPTVNVTVASRKEFMKPGSIQTGVTAAPEASS
jgi:cyclophilin family peptidyl-prolyl cis-trans isomerase